MAFTKINAAGIGSTETVTLDGLTVINDGSFGGNVSVGGTLTYEDVTNIDSVGLITARAGVVVGSGITLSKDGDVFFTGIATGNGSGLTALNASNISSGTVPTARLGSGTASSSTFLRGDSTFAAVTSTTINNNADNRVITGSDTADTLEAEEGLTFNSGSLKNTGSGFRQLLVGSTNAGGVSLVLDGDSNGDATGGDYAYFEHDTSGDLNIVADNPADAANIIFKTNSSTERYRIKSDGKLQAANPGFIYTSSSSGSLTLAGGNTNLGGKILLNGGSNGGDIRFHAEASTATPAERARIDSSGRLLLGTTTEGASNADDLTVATSGHTGITIRSGTSNQGNIFFSDGTSGADEYRGYLQYEHTNNALIVGTDATDRLTISSSGKVRVGSGYATYPFEVYGADQQTILIGSTNAGGVYLTLDGDSNGDGSGGDYASIGHTTAGDLEISADNPNGDANIIFFAENSDEKARIRSSGVLQVNTSVAPGGNPSGGGSNNSGGFLHLMAANSENAMSIINATTISNSDAKGTVLAGINFINRNYYEQSGKAGTGYVIRSEKGHGSYMDRCQLRLIPGYDGNTLYSDRSVVFDFDGHIKPGQDNNANLGGSSFRWGTVYAATSSINTSDETLKQDITTLTAAEMNAAKRLSKLFVTYKWKKSVSEKGDKARIHTGVIAQRIKEALEAEGLTAANYSFWCENITWKDSEGNVAGDGRTTGPGVYDELTNTTPSTDGYTKSVDYAVRYTELLSFVAAYNEQRFTSIESRLSALEG